MALTRSIGAYDDGTVLVPGIGTTPIDTRKSLSALWASAGVVAGGPSPLVTGTAGFAYQVAGPVPLVTTRGVSDGFQMFTNDGNTTVPITNAAGATLTGAPGSGLQRIDIIWVQHRTNTENSDLTSAPRFGVESGTAVSSSPAAPSLPTGALELARNTMTSAATSTSSAGNTISQTAAAARLRGALTPKGPIYAGNKMGAVCSSGTFYAISGWATTINNNVTITGSGGTHTIPLEPGYYRAKVRVQWNPNEFGLRWASVNLNSGGVSTTGQLTAVSENAPTVTTTPYSFNQETDSLVLMNGTTDYIEVFAMQSSGYTVNCNVFVELTLVSAP